MNNIYMQRAIELAKKAYEINEVPIGALVVRDGEIIAQSYNQRESKQSALAHAEIISINQACEKLGSWRLSDCDLYVTLEPCPMCMGAIINSRIRSVYFGAYDKKAGSCGSLVNLNDYPFNHHPLIFPGIMELECSKLLSDFFRELRSCKNK